MNQTTWPANEAPTDEPDPAPAPGSETVYSVRCPSCFALTGEADDQCSECGHVTSWTSYAEFADVYLNAKQEGTAQVLRGAITTIIGVIVLIGIAAAVFLLNLELNAISVAVWLGICAVALHRGIFMFRRGRCLMLFE
tara:strand:+ start:650 stop:1063 length:414 start_codon:yes stop_codon:yes gene_type:complete